MDASPLPAGASRAAIQHHYDVGNEFYALWLDPTLSYSCALWREGDNLEQAQRAKIAHHLAQIAPPPGARVLDVGCGWGATLFELVGRHHAAAAIGLTLSERQKQHIDQTNVPGVEVLLESWEDHRPAQPYDGIVSVGAFEHFARPDLSAAQRVAIYRRFFGRCHDWLKPGGRLSVQTIACGNMRREDFSSFFASEIFPESDLPTLGEIAEAADCLFEIESVHNDRRDYARTLKAWRANLAARRAEAEALVGPETVHRYDRYFMLAAIAFDALGSMVLLRLALTRIDQPRRKA